LKYIIIILIIYKIRNESAKEIQEELESDRHAENTESVPDVLSTFGETSALRSAIPYGHTGGPGHTILDGIF
jgi:hypothetical protein